MANLRENLQKNLAEIINKSNMSKKEIAEKLGVSAASVTKWVKGDNAPDIEIIAKICDLFKISINSLLKIPTSTNENKIIDKRKQSIINNFDMMNEQGKNMLFDYSNYLIEKYIEPDQKEKHA